MEIIFNIAYLLTVTALGILILKKSKGVKEHQLFGFMALVLGFGDAFHLFARSQAILTTGFEANAGTVGAGKLITSITMTFFYILLYIVWKQRYHINNILLTRIIYSLAFIRIVLCLFPQNRWFEYQQAFEWGIYRNIPFALMGIIIIVLFYKETKKNKNDSFKHMWLAITLSFAFYVPVVLFVHIWPLIGMLMIPKTLAYVWIVVMGYRNISTKS